MDATSERLAGIRIVLFGFVAVRLIGHQAFTRADQPAALYRPVSFLHLLDRAPPRGVLLAVAVIGVPCALLAAAGVAARATGIAAWLALVLFGAVASSASKIVHNDVLLILALLPLLLAPTADVWTLGRRLGWPAGAPSARYGYPLAASFASISAVYFLIGMNKMLLSGPAWFASDNLRWVLYAASDGHREPVALALFVADRPLLAQALAFATVVIELTFPAIIVWPNRAWIWALAAVSLHLGIWATMGLDYSPWIVTVAVVLIDWPLVANALGRRDIRRAPSSPAAARQP